MQHLKGVYINKLWGILKGVSGMKRRIGIIAMVIAFMMSSISVSAKSVSFTGQIDGDVKAVTVMVTQKGADLYNLQFTDIVYMNQASVSEDGTFTLKMPLLEGDFDTHTNAGNYEIEELPKNTMYISDNGNDNNDGLSQDKPKKTFANIYRMLDEVGEIILLSDMTFSLPTTGYEGTLTIKGNTGNEKLSVGGMSLKGSLKLDNLVFNGTNTSDANVSCYIFANGYSLEMGDKLTSTGRLTVYGGKSGEVVETTDLKLYGGQYRGIYGGGYNGAVTGDTNVIVGGNVNPNDGVDDSNSSTLSPTYVYGGSYGAAVGGKTNVTITGDATVNTVVGAGNVASGTVADTNISITGGNVMNVYGGALSGGPVLENCNTHIIMSGGKVEGIFGGSEEKLMSGNTYITLSGGEVTRRIFGGCYTESGTGKYVSGVTTINVYPESSLCTGNGLSWINKLDTGIYAGSRNSTNSSEKNYIIFYDDSYDSNSSKIEKTATYTLDISKGGEVELNQANAQIVCSADMGRGVLVNNQRVGNKMVTLSAGLNTIVFDGITSATAEKQESGVTGDVTVSTNESYVLLAAVYDAADKRLIGAQIVDYSSGDKDFDLNVNCSFEQGRKYIVQLFLWKDLEMITPLTTQYVIDLK